MTTQCIRDRDNKKAELMQESYWAGYEVGKAGQKYKGTPGKYALIPYRNGYHAGRDYHARKQIAYFS